MNAPLVYLLLGIPDSGRRAILSDLIRDGIPEKENVLYFRSGNEPPSPEDAVLEAIENVTVVDWQLSGAKVAHGEIKAAPEKIFFLAPGGSDPADFVEAVKSWIDHNHCELARVLTVVHCQFLASHESAHAWFNACIHFSDVVLLNRRDGIDQKWTKDFAAGFKKNCYPCRFELVKKNQTQNPASILEPEARRVSLFFDTLIPIEEDAFEDAPEDTKPDRYIERNESGQRAYPIPDIAQFF